MFTTKDLKNRCVEWIRSWFEKNGDGCNAVIGISGGKDSSVVAALCVEALGKERVIGVLMPDGVQNDIAFAYLLVNTLGIRYKVCNIFRAVEDITQTIESNIDGGCMCVEMSQRAKINLPARVRMATLYAVSQSCNGRVANTCNLSEDYVGYSTRYGDSAGDFSPLALLTTDEVVAIGDELGLPESLTHKTPSDGLSGKTDEDNLGFTYAQLNKYIRTGFCEDPEVKYLIDTKHKQNLFKLQPIPHFDPAEEIIKT